MEAGTIIRGAKIYTADKKKPFADTVCIRNGKIVHVGYENEPEIQKFMTPDVQTLYLDGELIIPGIIDGHTHPSAVSKSRWTLVIPSEIKNIEDKLKYIMEFAKVHPPEEVPYIYAEDYPSDAFDEYGPRKEMLDEYVADRPVCFMDFSSHACLFNSKALELMEVPVGGTEPLGNIQFIRDEKGRPTGWAKEPLLDSGFQERIFKKIGWHPPEYLTEELVSPFLDFLRSKGVIAILDGFTENENDLKVFYDLDIRGVLNMHYHGMVLLNNYGDLDRCINQLKDWQRKYTTNHIKINTVKFFLDGTNEMGTGAMIEPINISKDGQEYGIMNMSEDELFDVLLRLNDEKIDLHLHVVGDRSFRTVCNAVERAKNNLGDNWVIMVQMAHCEIIHKDDMRRPGALGIIINWSPHWSGGYFGDASKTYFGEKRFNTMYDFREVLAAGCPVNYSSDVTTSPEEYRADPYFGIEIGHTRYDPEEPIGKKVREPKEAILSREELLNGYTVKGAIPLRLTGRIGSITEGKDANLVVLNKDLFEVPADEIHAVEPEMVMFEGKIVYVK